MSIIQKTRKKCQIALLGIAVPFFFIPNVAHADILDLVCENVRATQTNFQKGYFDSYYAATDSANSRFTVDAGGNVSHFYPATSSSSSDEPDYKIFKSAFHNLTGNQAFLDGIGMSDMYIKSISFHRNQSGQWSLQVTNSGNSEDRLFHRVYYYECVSMKDEVN